MEAQGLDCSHWQGEIDWQNVEDKYKFAIIKATEGTTFKDPKFDFNWFEAKEADKKVGAYHFFRPGIDPEGQASYFFEAVGELSNGDIIPWLDVEVNQSNSNRGEAIPYSQILTEVWRCLIECKTLFRSEIGIYTGSWFWSKMPVGTMPFPLWVAHWKNEVGNPQIPHGWEEFQIHQYTSKGQVSGINGNVDLNWTPDLSKILYGEEESPRNKRQEMKDSIRLIQSELTLILETIEEI